MQIVYAEIERQQDIVVDCNVDAELESLRVRLEKLEDKALDQMAAHYTDPHDQADGFHGTCPTGNCIKECHC